MTDRFAGPWKGAPRARPPDPRRCPCRARHHRLRRGISGEPAPVISSFSAGPASVVLGASSTLSWTVANATSLALDQGIGAVTGDGTVVIPGVSTTYALTATGPGGIASAPSP